MKENELCVVKEYKFDNPLITDVDSEIDKCFRDCHKKYFHNFENKCIYDIKLTNITNNESISLTISDKSINLYKLRKKINSCQRKWSYF